MPLIHQAENVMKDKLKTFFIQGIIFFVTLEVLLAVCVSLGVLDIERPYYSLKKKDYWTLKDSEFGVWREPKSSYRHIKGCFDVTYTANQAPEIKREVSKVHKNAWWSWVTHL